MAKLKVVCVDCGNELSPEVQFCSKCGAEVGKRDVAPQQRVPPTVAKATCEVCGHENVHGGGYCEACGAELPGRFSSAPIHVSPSKAKKSVLSKKDRSTKDQVSSFRLLPWHYAVGVIILALVGYFIYVELQREYPAAGAAQVQPGAQMQFPLSQTPSTPPSVEILDAIDRFQKTVKENPNDAGAKLMLANALHDGAMHDGAFFPRAIEAYKNYLKDKPGDPNARVDLGICYFELGKIDSTQSASLFSQAINEMESTVKNNPKHQPGAFNLGIVYLYSGDMKESNKWLQKTVELNPESELGKRAKSILEQHSQAG